MKLDPDQLRADADAHQARLKSSLWTEAANEDPAEDWMAGVTVGDVTAVGTGARAAPASLHRDPELLARRELRYDPDDRGERRHDPEDDVVPLRLEELSRAVVALTESVARMRAERLAGGERPASEGVPAWLRAAAGNPQTYDAPDPARTSVCVRVLPTTYARLQNAQARLGLRTTAGAWECLLRLGLAAAERLPAR